jgi:hypothetical protein
VSGTIRAADRLRELLTDDRAPCTCRIKGRQITRICLVHWSQLLRELGPAPMDDLAVELGFELGRGVRPTSARSRS